MKKIIVLGILFFNSFLFSQNYNFDPTFGTNGIAIFQNSGLNPIDGLLIDNYYYFISYNQFRKMAYDGSGDTSFGTNGIVTIDANQYPDSQQPSSIKGFKFINNYFYVYGTADANNGNDSFIYKIDSNGNLDTAFGTNGVARINFGASEILADLVSDSNGNLLCVGSRVVTENNGMSSQLVYFKISSATGIINTSFDVNGYKAYAGSAFSRGNAIQKTEDNFMLLGSASGNALIFKIDANGNSVDSFGTNGSRLFPLPIGEVTGMQFYNNELYVKYYWGSSYISQGTNLLKYNLTSGQKIFELGSYRTTYFKVMDDGIYITGTDYCNYANHPYGCGRPFTLKKLHFDGTPDTSFQNGGTFNYSFYPTADSQSSIFIKDDNGKILIGGMLSGSPFNNTSGGNTFIRLGEGELNTENPGLAEVMTIYPNPFSDRLTIQSQYEITEAAIFDVNGRNVDNPKIIWEQGQAIVLTNIAQKGLYILKATTADGRQIVQKIIKE